MGLEPTTPGLGSQYDGGDARRRTACIALNGAGLQPMRYRIKPAWLRGSFSDRFGHVLATDEPSAQRCDAASSSPTVSPSSSTKRTASASASSEVIGVREETQAVRSRKQLVARPGVSDNLSVRVERVPVHCHED